MKEIQEILRIRPATLSPATPTPEDSHSSDSSRTTDHHGWSKWIALTHLVKTDHPNLLLVLHGKWQKLASARSSTWCVTASMDNKDCHKLTDSFTLPKVMVMKTPDLDKIMTEQRSKSIKTNDQALARIQALNSDALGPLTELLELLNREDDEEEAPDLRERVGYAVESAITLLGNAFVQMSALRRQKVLEEYNKELITFAQGKEREAEFLKVAPNLFG